MKRAISRTIDLTSRRSTSGRQLCFVTKSPPNFAGLYPYQRVGVRWLLARKRSLLADEPGVGKTAQVLRAQPAMQGLFVVCPAFLMRVWRQEAAKFRPDLLFTMGETRRPNPGEIVCESYDSLPDFPMHARALLPAEDWSHVTVCFDEVQYAKNPQAARSAKALRLAYQAGRVIGATGTPIDNSPLDLWGILLTLGLTNDVFGPDPWGEFKRIFKAKWIQFGPNKSAGDWRFGKPTEDIRALLDTVMLRRTKREVLPDLPRKTYQDVPVPVDSDAVRALLDDATEAWPDPDELPPFELLSGARKALADIKTPFACTYVAHISKEEPVVVFSAHVQPIEAIAKLSGAKAITGATPDGERARLVAAFQRGEFSILALTIGAGGVGITLTRSHHVVFVDREYTPGANEQAEDRCVRIGQKDHVQIDRLVSDHPLDVRLTKILDAKQRIIVASLGG